MYRTGAFQAGLLGVEIFFVLSGFLIGNILYRSFALKNHLTGQDLLNFYKRRWWRTLPLYYLIIAVKFIYNHAVGLKIFHFIFFIQNYYDDKFFAVSWSLAIEEWFYLLVPFLLFLFYKFSKNNQNVIGWLSLFIFVTIILKFIFPQPFHTIRLNVPLRMDSLCIGVLLAFIKNLKPTLYDILKKPIWVLMSFVMCAFLMYCTLGFTSRAGLLNDFSIIRALWFPILSFTIALAFPFIESNTFINVFLAGGKWILIPVTWISLLTYSIYLIHPLVLTFKSFWSGLIISNGISLTIILIVSYLLYRFYERPMTQLRDK